MSENLDLVRSIYADWERGDFGHVEWASPDIEYTGVDGLSPGTSRGIRPWEQAGASSSLTGAASVPRPRSTESLTTSGCSCCIALAGAEERAESRSGHTGAKGACLFFVADGKITKLSLYSVRDRAFADLGLAE